VKGFVIVTPTSLAAKFTTDLTVPKMRVMLLPVRPRFISAFLKLVASDFV
jgi:hypothetical protein